MTSIPQYTLETAIQSFKDEECFLADGATDWLPSFLHDALSESPEGEQALAQPVCVDATGIARLDDQGYCQGTLYSMKKPDPDLLREEMELPFLEKTYPGQLPEELRPWYCYPADSGHSILVVLDQHWTHDLVFHHIKDFLIPIPVKTVLRKYELRGGFVVALTDQVRYDSKVGAIVPPEDEEY